MNSLTKKEIDDIAWKARVDVRLDAGQREAYLRLVAHICEQEAALAEALTRVAELHAKADALIDDLMLAYENGSAPPAKAKRKPVAASKEQMQEIETILARNPRDLYSPKDISDKFSNLGLETCAAALKHLVAEGKATMTTRGRFRAVEQPAESDGAGG